MRAEPFLCLGSVEVGNSLRTLTYLRRGLGGRGYEVSTRHPLITEENCQDVLSNDVYTAAYHSTYSGTLTTVCDPVDAFDPQNLHCYCEAMDDGPYVDPATDDAPWYESGRPESADFLGFVPFNITVRPSLARGFGQGVLGGSLGPVRAGGQVMAVDGLMFATTRPAMDYGERWLTAVVSGELCDDDPAAVFLPACNDDDDSPWRSLLHVGLVDELVIAQVADGVAECRMQRATFQLASESPWRVSDPELLDDNALMFHTDSASHLVEVDAWPGDAALRLTVQAGSTALAGLRLVGRATDGDCPPAAAMPCFDFTLEELPAGFQMIVDGVDRIVEVRNPATGDVLGGRELFTYLGPWTYPELAPCSTTCVTFTATNGTGGHRTLEVVRREL